MMSTTFMPSAVEDRRAAAAAQRALEQLRAGLALNLERLLDDVGCPAGAEPTIRSWLGHIRSDNPTSALTPEALENVLRSLTIAYADRCAFAGHKPSRWRPGAPVDLEITDRGGGIVIRAVRSAAAEIVRGLHGRNGATLLRRVQNAEGDLHRSIAIAIGRVP